jgi:hypothetical protein
VVTLPDRRWCAVRARTRSEVRGEAKKALGLDRLPPGAVMEEL